MTKPDALHAGYDAVLSAAHAVKLDIAGAFHPGPEHGCPTGTGTLILLSPLEPQFWPAFQASPEFQDEAPEPMDRWSMRVIGQLAREHHAQAIFPFGGAPYQPFLRWASASKRAWDSPVGLLIHDRAGLFISYRGALALPARLALPAPPTASPCLSCQERPCLNACPIGALDGSGYDVPACRAYIAGNEGRDCIASGCAVRRACPVSVGYGRLPAQSAFHMKAFQ